MVIIKCKIEDQTLFVDRHGFWQLDRPKAKIFSLNDAEKHADNDYAVAAMKRAGGVVSLEPP